MTNLKTLSLLQLVEAFEMTETMPLTDELPVVREWIMDELEARNAEAFEAWMLAPGAAQPRAFYL